MDILPINREKIDLGKITRNINQIKILRYKLNKLLMPYHRNFHDCFTVNLQDNISFRYVNYNPFIIFEKNNSELLHFFFDAKDECELRFNPDQESNENQQYCSWGNQSKFCTDKDLLKNEDLTFSRFKSTDDMLNSCENALKLAIKEVKNEILTQEQNGIKDKIFTQMKN